MATILPFSHPALGTANAAAGTNEHSATGMDFGNNVNNNGTQDKTINLLDSANSNPLPKSGLAKGGGSVASAGGAGGYGQGGAIQQISFAGTNKDWRVRISVNPGSVVLYRGTSPGIMSPLLPTDGVIFPFTPSISVSHTTNYGAQALTHTNYASYYYQSSQVSDMQVSGEFSVQNSSDASYLLAAIYFFRAAGKMFYGDSGAYQGSPPPILYLNGYGKHYFPNVPCVLTSFTHSLPNDVDYINTKTIKGGTTRVPTNSTITLGLQPVYSRTSQTKFDHQKFASGGQLTKGFI